MLAKSILRDLSPRWSAAVLNHQFHGPDTHQKKVKKTSSELLQSCATALCKISLFLRVFIKVSSTDSKYWNGGLRHFVGTLLIQKLPQALREERTPSPELLERSYTLHCSSSMCVETVGASPRGTRTSPSWSHADRAG